MMVVPKVCWFLSLFKWPQAAHAAGSCMCWTHYWAGTGTYHAVQQHELWELWVLSRGPSTHSTFTSRCVPSTFYILETRS
jgi:hypothetical protein